MTIEPSTNLTCVKTKFYQTDEDEPEPNTSLLWEVERLRLKLDKVKQEKTKLLCSQKTLKLHAQTLSALVSELTKKLEVEQRDRQQTESTYQFLVTNLLREKADLEIMLDTIVEHSDLMEELLHEQCIRDPLTGLFNRRYLAKSLERELCRAQLTERSLGLIMLDVDHFKRFNDTYGHEAGDVVLRELGWLLKTESGPLDIPCRYGGEEFMVILPEASLEKTQQQGEHLRKAVKRLNLTYLDQDLPGVSISVGVAVFPQHGLTETQLMQAVDAALYQGKTQGRDRVVIATI
ncbi:GGDEF domain-containing protein [Oscillatoria acuminata]|uniref:Diguanylate cyclase (GGDEF) domain-containing protein n=1 Tax=Oscillatoria acuminata PCC 6304 TaxID=56110 RepID=K9TKB7_9CYAN|nr:GGDEF domain-containing protein [Oscillatoria acuminata]AFY82990.1 diguanylate cyclase (GGDEF) domain-containing protein [Oscillatoria acuminata PCC 6304]